MKLTRVVVYTDIHTRAPSAKSIPNDVDNDEEIILSDWHESRGTDICGWFLFQRIERIKYRCKWFIFISQLWYSDVRDCNRPETKCTCKFFALPQWSAVQQRFMIINQINCSHDCVGFDDCKSTGARKKTFSKSTESSRLGSKFSSFSRKYWNVENRLCARAFGQFNGIDRIHFRE